MRLRPEETMLILVRLQQNASVPAVQKGLKIRLPNVDVWTREEFARQARFYWISKTGAGGAILMAALLGFLVGLAVASQAIYATTMENIEEFATLKALGASHAFIMRVIITQAFICGIGGLLLGGPLSMPGVPAGNRG